MNEIYRINDDDRLAHARVISFHFHSGAQYLTQESFRWDQRS